MNYANYDTQVIQKYQCKIIGWTFNKLVSPFDINTVDELRTLRDALRCGACFWVRMTKAEVSKHAADLVLREAAGEVIGKKRKERSDKGIKKGLRAKRGVNDEGDSSDDDDEAGPSKKKSRPQPKAKVKGTTTAKTGKKGKTASNLKGKTTSKGKGPKGRSSKSQLPPSKPVITDTDSERNPEDNPLSSDTEME
jgi:hypothetical protein